MWRNLRISAPVFSFCLVWRVAIAIALREDCFENWLDSWLSLKEAVLDIRVNIDSLIQWKGSIQDGIND